MRSTTVSCLVVALHDYAYLDPDRDSDDQLRRAILTTSIMTLDILSFSIVRFWCSFYACFHR